MGRWGDGGMGGWGDGGTRVLRGVEYRFATIAGSSEVYSLTAI
uniref:Uncharacterized protein n=1 Tax=Desertifilum tharense IPPAS B-1220 TaxID=1781255 RepID=A0ACD5GU83_9CYAN